MLTAYEAGRSTEQLSCAMLPGPRAADARKAAIVLPTEIARADPERLVTLQLCYNIGLKLESEWKSRDPSKTTDDEVEKLFVRSRDWVGQTTVILERKLFLGDFPAQRFNSVHVPAIVKELPPNMLCAQSQQRLIEWPWRMEQHLAALDQLMMLPGAVEK